jgi:hypothetical protein
MHGHAPVVSEIMIGQSARERKATMQALAIMKRSSPFLLPEKTGARR